MQAPADLTPLNISRIFVLGIGQWKYEYMTVADAAAGVQDLDRKIHEEGVRLDFIEVLIEFASGESERCSFKDKQRVFAWLDRFEPLGFEC